MLKLLIRVSISLAFLIPCVSMAASNTPSTGYVVTGLNPVEIDVYSDCKIARSTNSNSYFAPTNQLFEWSAFKNVHNPDGTDVEMYDCALPDTQCRLAYQYKIDNKMGQIRYTPWTNNTTSYVTGPYSITKTGKDDTCNGDQGCGIRVGVQCTGDYGINVTYRMQFEGINGAQRTTGYPTLGGGVRWGLWSEREYETGDSECSSPNGCRIQMSVEHNYTGSQSITCSIGYQHRDEQSVSGWEYDNAWAQINSSGSEGENCEGAGCGMQAELYCAGPPPGTNSGAPPTSGQVDGQCGAANGQVYSGGQSGVPGPPSSSRCSVGAVTNYQYSSGTGGAEWTWSCLETGGGVSDNCVAFNGDYNWNPPGDPDCGQNEAGAPQQIFSGDSDSQCN